MLKRFWRIFLVKLKSRFWLLIAGGATFYGLFVWRLGSLTPGLSPNEVQAAAASSSLKQIIDNPIYGPHKLLQWLAQNLFGAGPASLRLPSVIFAGLIIISFYVLAAKWFGRFIGLVATAVLIGTPLVVISGRQASPAILLLMPVVMLSTYHWLLRQKRWFNLAWLVFVVVMALSLYVPGMIYILLAATVVSRSFIWSVFRRLKLTHLFLGALLFLALISPLVYAATQNQNLIRQILLLPTVWGSVGDFIKTAGWSMSSLFVRAESHSELIVGRMPILSAIQLVLLFFGIYAMSTLARKKMYVLLALAGLGILTSTINSSPVYLLLALVPLLTIDAAGLRYLFLEWQAIFPKNPLPKYFAYLLMLGLAAVQIGYGATYSLSAWPHTSETKSTYVLK